MEVNMASGSTNQSQWHLSKSIPVAIIVGLIIQTVSMAWWMSSWKTETEQRLSYIEEEQEELKQTRDKIVETNANIVILSHDMEKLEEQLEGIDEKLDILTRQKQ